MDVSCDDIKHERELREQWQEAHKRIHEMEQESLALARQSIDGRLDEMNQLRAQISAERGFYVSREYYDQNHNSLRDSLMILINQHARESDTRLKLLETTKSNLEGRLWMMGAAISGVVIVVNFILYYMGKRLVQ